MSQHFCATCNRVRLSATGALHMCLGHDDAIVLAERLMEAMRRPFVLGDVELIASASIGVTARSSRDKGRASKTTATADERAHRMPRTTDSRRSRIVIAISVVALIPSVVVFFMAQRHFIEGASSSGIKG